jgi:hypothetical protein
MIFEEILVRYLDDQTSPIEDEEMMSQLAVSPDKREMLHAHLRMRDSMIRDAAQLRPSNKQRAAAIAALIATAAGSQIAGAGKGVAGATGQMGRMSLLGPMRSLAAVGFSAAGIVAGVIGTYAVLAPSINRGAAPALPANLPAPITQQVAPNVAMPNQTSSPSPRIVHDQVVVPETVFVARPSPAVHDTIVIGLPAPKTILIPPTTTIRVDTINPAPPKK